MFEKAQQPATPYETAASGNLVFLSQAGSNRNRLPAPVATVARRGGTIMPVLLLLVLAVAAVALRPDTAQFCAKLEDFPCGP